MKSRVIAMRPLQAVLFFTMIAGGKQVSVLLIPIYEILSPYATIVTKNQYKPVWVGLKLLMVFILNPEPLFICVDENTNGFAGNIGDVVVA